MYLRGQDKLKCLGFVAGISTQNCANSEQRNVSVQKATVKTVQAVNDLSRGVLQFDCLGFVRTGCHQLRKSVACVIKYN